MRPALRLALMAMLLLSACNSNTSGYVSISFGTGYVYFETTGWYYQTGEQGATVTVIVTPQGNAQVQSASWSVLEHPLGYPPVLSDPWSTTTDITFPAAGIYLMEFQVDYLSGGNLYRRTDRVTFDIVPPPLIASG